MHKYTGKSFFYTASLSSYQKSFNSKICQLLFVAKIIIKVVLYVHVYVLAYVLVIQIATKIKRKC